MIPTTEREAIYQAQQKDRWEFKRDTNGYFWLRIAQNGEVVGVSHRTFTQLHDCEANARAVGYANEFTLPRNAVWEFLQDAKGNFTWRLLDSKGIVINRSHQGFEDKLTAEKNAVRHGYSLVSSVESPETSVQCGSHECREVTCGVSRKWLGLSIVVVFFGLIAASVLFQFLVTQKENIISADDTAQIFTDLESTDEDITCINRLHGLEAFSVESTNDTLQFLPNRTVTKAELAKALLAVTDNGPLACAPTSQELPGEEWSDSYLHCAKAKDWRVFRSADEDYNMLASKQDLAYSILDAFAYTVEDALQVGILRSLGNFEPTETFTRRDLVRVLCATEAKNL